jgi:hypothetical protein
MQQTTTQSLGDPEDFIIEDIIEAVKSYVENLEEKNLSEIQNDFLELRYYLSPSKSGILKRMKKDASKNTTDSSIQDPTLCQKFSFDSITSELPEPTSENFTPPQRNITPSKHVDDIPAQLGQKAASNTHHSSSPLIELVLVIQELTAVYLQGVNIMIETQTNSLGKLAVYCMLVG